MATTQPTSFLAMSVTAQPPARLIIAPKERSKSCMTSGTVRPAATIRAGAAAVRMFFQFSQVGNVSGLAMLKTTTISTKAMITP